MTPPHPLPALLAPQPGPSTLKTRPWGGTRLQRIRRSASPVSPPIGESWEFSTMAGSGSRCDGIPLADRLGGPLPLLAKLLDTAVTLSVQVHPDDDAATGTLGKEEAWVILEAEPDAVLYAGLRDDVDEATFAAAVRAGDDVLPMLTAVPARPGLVMLIPTGTVHAVGGGVLLAEVQQPADTTLRLYDHGSDRPLQIDAALAAMRPQAVPAVHDAAAEAGRLRGKHVELEILAPGRHERRAAGYELLVPVHGGAAVTAAGERHELGAGDLRLATEALEYIVDVPAHERLVIGTCRPWP